MIIFFLLDWIDCFEGVFLEIFFLEVVVDNVFVFGCVFVIIGVVEIVLLVFFLCFLLMRDLKNLLDVFILI